MAPDELSRILQSFLPTPVRWWGIRHKKRQKLCPELHNAIKGALWSNDSRWLEEESTAIQQLEACADPELGLVHFKVLDVNFPRRKHARLEGNNSLSCTRNLAETCGEGKSSGFCYTLGCLDQKGVHIETIFYCLLQGCINKKDLATGRELHSCIIRKGLESNTFLGCHLIRMFGLCGSLSEANQVFNKLPAPNGFTWSAIISAHTSVGQEKDAIKLYYRMHQSPVTPGDHAFVSVLKACSSLAALDHGKQIHAHIVESGCELDIYVGTTLIDMYSKCGYLEDARQVFDKLSRQDVVTWSTMIAGYTEYGDCPQALQIFHQMREEGMEPDNVTFVCILKACSTLAAQDQGKLIYARIIKQGSELDIFVGSTLIDLYVKCGNLGEACKVFAKLSKRNVVTWSAMIAGCAQLGNYKLAFRYFTSMLQEGVKPNDVTFVSILSACSHVGLLYEGLQYFKSMWSDHGIIPALDHYNCMVDLLGRAGYLIAAENVLQTMPFKPNIVGCMALLSHCRTHGDMEVGKHCFDQVIPLDHRQASSYFLMAEIYSDSDMKRDADSVKAKKKCSRAWKKPGEAFIEIDKRLHSFLGGESSHPFSDNIHAKLNQLIMCLKVEGFVPHLDLILHQILGGTKNLFVGGENLSSIPS